MSKTPHFHTGKLPLEFLQGLLQQYTHQHERLVAGPSVGEDVAVIDMGDRYLVVKTDPITFATDQIGWYAVHVNANDIATSGATPLWMLNTILLPEGKTDAALIDGIFRQLHDACAQLGIVLVGGHTEVTHGLDRPIVVGVLLGEATKEQMMTTADAQEGDALVLVKGIAIEATAIIAREKANELLEKGYEEAFIERAQSFLYEPGISVLGAAKIAAIHPGVHALHDPTEGGLATGIHEMAYAAGTGAFLDADSVPLYPESARLCEEYDLNPLGLIASGALLVAVAPDQADSLCQRYATQNIAATRIGALTDPSRGYRMVHQSVDSSLPRFDIDEITRIF